ncbi:hypothetical protein GCM10020295_05030 [Streptomyces cinereospinus]
MTLGRPEEPKQMPTRPAALLLRSATVVDTRDGSRRPGTDVLVQDGVITAVGPALAAPDGTVPVDARGRYVVPGFNDMHAHPLGAAVTWPPPWN